MSPTACKGRTEDCPRGAVRTVVRDGHQDDAEVARVTYATKLHSRRQEKREHSDQSRGDVPEGQAGDG